MQIAIVHSRYKSAEPSGENAVVDDQVQALRSAGHDVRLFERRTDDLTSARSYRLESALTTLTGRGHSPKLKVGTWAPDVVHVHNTFPNWGTLWTKPWSDRLVVTLHNYRPICAAATLFRDGHECTDCLRQPVRPAISHACYRGSRFQTLPLALASRPKGSLRSLPGRAARVIVLNSTARNLFESVLGRPVDLIPNFVDAPPVTEWRANDADRWAYVGRLTPEKGIVELLRAFPKNGRLDVYGAGPQEQAVRALAATSEGRIVFHGIVDRPTLRTKLANQRGLIIPSLWSEGLPTVALEAMAAGVPLVLSDHIAAAGELCMAGAGVTYAPGDPTSLLQALGLVASERHGYALSAQSVFSNTYSKEAWLQQITSLYDQVVK